MPPMSSETSDGASDCCSSAENAPWSNNEISLTNQVFDDFSEEATIQQSGF